MERDELTMLLAANIQAAMDEKQTDAAKLARQAKINPTGIYDILKGKSASPKLVTVKKIADALGMSVQSLLRDREQQDLHSQIMDIIDALPLDEQKRLLVTAKAWSASDE